MVITLFVIFFFRKSILLLLFLLLSSAHAENYFGIQTMEEAFAISTLMSDSEALTFGFINFDLNVDSQGFGSEDTVKLKNSIDVITIPYTWYLDSKSTAWSHALTLRASYIKTKRDHDFDDINGEFQENTFGVYGSYSQFFNVTKHWYLESGLGLHVSYYENTYDYGSNVSDEVQHELDKVIFNVSTLALIIEPEMGIGYRKAQNWGRWKVYNGTNYIYGHGIAGSYKNPGSINPEGWRLSNGAEFSINVPELWGVHDFLAIDFKRIDVFGDLEGMAEKGHYYETSLGWVIDTNNQIPFLDNFGIGLSFNYGSSISGGTVVLYYNEE